MPLSEPRLLLLVLFIIIIDASKPSRQYARLELRHWWHDASSSHVAEGSSSGKI
jgi:hypothetical protein